MDAPVRPGNRLPGQAILFVPATELLRRFLVGALFGIHTMRFRIFLSPGSGRSVA